MGLCKGVVFYVFKKIHWEVQLQVTYTLMALVKNKCSDCDKKVYCDTEVLKGGWKGFLYCLNQYSNPKVTHNLLKRVFFFPGQWKTSNTKDNSFQCISGILITSKNWTTDKHCWAKQINFLVPEEKKGVRILLVYSCRNHVFFF